MSKQGTSISPKLIFMVVVLVGLAIVIFINVRALLPEGSSPAAAIVIEGTELSPPGDLGEVTSSVALFLADPVEPGAGTTTDRRVPASLRNPFEYETKRSAPARKKKPRARREELACTAIFVGVRNGPPTAIVGGRVLGVGDRISKYKVEEITRQGVTLSEGGRRKFLPLTQQKASSGAVGAPVALGH